VEQAAYGPRAGSALTARGDWRKLLLNVRLGTSSSPWSRHRRWEGTWPPGVFRSSAEAVDVGNSFKAGELSLPLPRSGESCVPTAILPPPRVKPQPGASDVVRVDLHTQPASSTMPRLVVPGERIDYELTR
jgi:hypothetical protein